MAASPFAASDDKNAASTLNEATSRLNFCGCAVAFFTAAGSSRIFTRLKKTDVSAILNRQPAESAPRNASASGA